MKIKRSAICRKFPIIPLSRKIVPFPQSDVLTIFFTAKDQLEINSSLPVKENLLF